MKNICLVKSTAYKVIRSFSGSYFPAFGLNMERYGEIRTIFPYSVRMWENTDQKNSEYGHFLRSERCGICIY